MRFKLTIVLILANLLVAFALYRIEQGSGPAEAFQRESAFIFGTEILDLDKLEIRGQGADGDSINRVVENRDGRWMITEPIYWPANPFAVENILNKLQFPEAESSFPVEEIERSGRTLADWGLQEPKLSLTFHRGELARTIRIGDPTPMGNRLYILGPDRERVLVISKALLESVLVNLDELRSQKVFDIPIFDIAALTVQISSGTELGGAGQRIRIERAGAADGQWRFAAPIQTQADPRRVERALSALTALNVRRFVKDPPPEAGLENPRTRITLSGQSRQTLLVGAPVADSPADEPRLYARLEDNPTVFTIAAGPVDALRNAQVALRERQFLRFNAQELTRIEIAQSDRALRLQRIESGEWQVLDRQGDNSLSPFSADIRILRDLVEALLRLEAQEFIADAPGSDLERFGLDDPRRTVTVSAGDTQTLLLGSPPRQTRPVYAKLESSPFVYAVNPRILDLLPVRPLHYRNRTVENLPEDARVVSLRLVRLPENGGGEAEPILERRINPAEQTWPLALEADEALSEDTREAVLSLVDAVKTFRADDYLADAFEPRAASLGGGREEPWHLELEAQVRLPGGEDEPRTFRYLFTKRLGGTTQIAGSPANKLTFTVRQPLIDALSELAFRQAGPLPTPPDLTPGPTKQTPAPPREGPESPASETGTQQPSEPPPDETGSPA